jgi:hypothetical protein
MNTKLRCGFSVAIFYPLYFVEWINKRRFKKVVEV